jgi:hypothetical protein
MTRRRFILERPGRWKRSAARGMARAGFPAAVIAVVLRLKRATAQAIVDCRDTPGSLWSAAERALFRGER